MVLAACVWVDRLGTKVPRDHDQDGRRKWARFRVDGSVRVLHPARASGEALDASAGGMRVRVDYPLQPGDRCIVDVRLRSGEETHERARVVWSRPDGRLWLAGLEFAEAAR